MLPIAHHEQQNQLDKAQYNCIICYNWYKKPISCNRCHHLICQQHLWGLRNRCPNCRLQPFQYTSQDILQKQIQLQTYKHRQHMKKHKTFKCLVQGCTFSGKYNQMVFHRKSRHFYQKIQQILYPEQRQNKLKKDGLMKSFFGVILKRAQFYKEKAMDIYVKTRGAFDINQIAKMVGHVDKCQHQLCKEVLFHDTSVYIGTTQQNGEIITSNCPKALQLQQTL